MRVNNPRSLVFIDGIENLSSSVTNFASVTYVSNAIHDSWQDNLGKYNYAAGPGILMSR